MSAPTPELDRQERMEDLRYGLGRIASGTWLGIKTAVAGVVLLIAATVLAGVLPDWTQWPLILGALALTAVYWRRGAPLRWHRRARSVHVAQVTDRTDVRQIDMQQRLARSWAGWAASIGESITLDETDWRGRPKVRVPKIVGYERTTFGQAFDVQVLPGSSPQDLVKKSDRLAATLGHPVRLAVTGPRTVRVQLVEVDPLAGVRRSHGEVTDGGIVVGRLDTGGDAHVDLRDASHLAIQGMTRSGKSAFCYTLLSPLAQDPAVIVGGIDPNRVLLAPWQAVERSAGWLSLGSDPAAAADLLGRYVEEMDRRMDVLDTLGIEALREFTPGQPLLVCVLEEFPAMIRAAEGHDAGAKTADRVGPLIRQRVARLVMEGAKAGIRVVLIAQRMDASIVDGAVRGQFGTRVTFAVDNSDAVTMLHPNTDPLVVDQVRHFPPGRCIFWRHRVQSIAQADLTEYSEYRSRLGAPAQSDRG